MALNLSAGIDSRLRERLEKVLCDYGFGQINQRDITPGNNIQFQKSILYNINMLLESPIGIVREY